MLPVFTRLSSLREQRLDADLTRVEENVRVGVGGDGLADLPDVLADDRPRATGLMHEADSPVPEIMG